MQRVGTGVCGCEYARRVPVITVSKRNKKKKIYLVGEHDGAHVLHDCVLCVVDRLLRMDVREVVISIIGKACVEWCWVVCKH